MIDFSELALSPNESRAARNFFGLSQSQAADKSKLPAHKLKRFETGTYLPDNQFLQDLREFYESQGYNFNDENTPGAKARANGDVFPAGVVGKTDSSTSKTDGFPTVEPGKLPRPQTANLQFMRISPSLGSHQIDQVFDCIEENEAALFDSADKLITSGWGDGPSMLSQAQAVSIMRRLAENGLLYARLMGRDLLPVVDGEDVKVQAKPTRLSLFGGLGSAASGQWATIGELMQTAMNDVQLAVFDGDKEALARRKGRAEPTEVLQALVG